MHAFEVMRVEFLICFMTNGSKQISCVLIIPICQIEMKCIA